METFARMESSQLFLLVCVLCAIGLQVSAAVLSLRLINVTGRLKAWVFVSLAITLMAVRRLMSLSWLVSGQAAPPLELAFELVGLATSVLMVSGIALIRPVFLSLRDSERAVRRMSAEQNLLLEHASDLVYRHDAQGLFQYVSPACGRITGYTPQEWMRHYATFHTDNPLNARAVASTETALRTGEAQPPYEVEVVDKSGSRVWLEVNEQPYLEGGRVAGLIGVARDITGRRAAECERERLVGELQAALGKVKTLSGLLPICASCKKIRDDKGYWNQLEGYIRDHTDATFTHGICPECARALYPDYYTEPAPSAAERSPNRG
jgi:PAS domain S-box-containing protein